MGQAQERLPWLSDEPVAAPAAAPRIRAAPAPPVRRSTAKVMWPFYLLLLLVVLGVAGGAWWLGTQQREAPPAQLPVEEPVASPAAPAAPPLETAPPEQASEGQPAAPVPRAAERPAERIAPSAPLAERSASASTGEIMASDGAPAAVAEATGRTVFPADEAVAAPPPLTGPRPIIVYHPQPNRGRVVQLGAFPSRTQADQAWRRIVRRYPYLSSKPKMVNTVEVRAVGGGRRTRMYRLQLGTSSQAQSAVICQQLERAGQSCVVIY